MPLEVSLVSRMLEKNSGDMSATTSCNIAIADN